MSGHTKGPWSVHVNSVVEGCTRSIATLTGADHYASNDQPYVAVVGSDGEVVCDNAHYYPQGLDPKNANLIAAAPDLLEAAEKVIEMNRQHAEDQYGDPEKAERWACVVILRAAIAKARGEA